MRAFMIVAISLALPAHAFAESCKVEAVVLDASKKEVHLSTLRSSPIGSKDSPLCLKNEVQAYLERENSDIRAGSCIAGTIGIIDGRVFLAARDARDCPRSW